MLNGRLSTQAYKGARDFFPEDMRIQNYIYDTWKKVCQSFGFEQYNFPILEPLEIFSAKSGEELVNDQIFSFEDKGGRKLAVRPELTPGTVRLIAQKYKELAKPLKWFMIGNNWRFEKPQLGRGREFDQLEVNIFGIKGVEADFEIFAVIIAIMRAFGAKEDMYEIRVSDRRLISGLLDGVLGLDGSTQLKVRRMMDKWDKMEKADFEEALRDLGLDQTQIEKIGKFMTGTLDTLEISSENEGLINIKKLFELLKESKMAANVKFDPSIIRGFDYSDGLVYEVYDKNPQNKRSIFGGERFDRLINIFGDFELPSTGFAMGDYTLLEFLKGWNLLPKFESEIDYFITLWPENSEKYFNICVEIAEKLRALGKNCFTWMEPNIKIEKQLKYANSKNAKNAIIVGEKELSENTVTVKKMSSGAQETKTLEKFLSELE